MQMRASRSIGNSRQSGQGFSGKSSIKPNTQPNDSRAAVCFSCLFFSYCPLFEFYVFNPAFDRHSNKLMLITLSSIGDCCVAAITFL